MLKLIGMIVLGIISATLSYYNKNYYVGVFNDILGREEDESVVTRVGRGFLYGFLFPIYLFLIIVGLIALLLFLIVAGIIAAVVFVMVWVTENILPHDWFGDLFLKAYSKIGLGKPAPSAAAPQSEPDAAAPSSSAPASPDAPASGAEEPKDKPEEPGINVTRTHKLD
jgi:predicted lipid-binding transport protein (Tim44 family)